MSRGYKEHIEYYQTLNDYAVLLNRRFEKKRISKERFRKLGVTLLRWETVSKGGQ